MPMPGQALSTAIQGCSSELAARARNDGPGGLSGVRPLRRLEGLRCSRLVSGWGERARGDGRARAQSLIPVGPPLGPAGAGAGVSGGRTAAARVQRHKAQTEGFPIAHAELQVAGLLEEGSDCWILCGIRISSLGLLALWSLFYILLEIAALSLSFLHTPPL